MEIAGHLQGVPWSDSDVSLVFVGEVNGDQFLDNGVAIALFVVFMFLVVILLAVSSLLHTSHKTTRSAL